VKRAVRLAAALLLAGGWAMLAPSAGEAASGATVTPTAEAWYQPNPSCGSPSGCLTTDSLPATPPAAVPTNPFPAGTMHVGVAGGQETARSYVGLDLSVVTGALATGTLTVPLDVAAGDGSSSPETAKIAVCLSPDPVRPAEGSIDPPPTPDCASTAPAKYVAAPQPHLEADLGPLLAGLPDALGLVLLPDAQSLAPTDAWRVVFSAHDRTDAAKTPPATVALTSVEPLAVPGQVPAAAPSAALQAAVQPVGPVTPAIEPVPAQAPAVIAPQPVAVAPAAVTTRTVGYAYPAVWLLPLALLVVMPMSIRCLTQDVTPRTG
jgi:hypothetical protein